jgi:flavorubredoxin
MIYDHETRILYTGDLFGGLSYKSDLYADESSWDGMKTFTRFTCRCRKG